MKASRISKTPKAAGPGIIPPGHVLTRAELCSRLRWERTAYRAAKKAGLPVKRFGRADYVLSDDVLRFFQALATDGGPDHGL
jgi:hypothetical protein